MIANNNRKLAQRKMFRVIIAGVVHLLPLLGASDFRTKFRNAIDRSARETNVSATCAFQLTIFAASLEDLNEDTLWAWKMLDATSKLQSGILAGNMADLGDFDECIEIAANGTEIRGKYCLGNMIYKANKKSKNFFKNEIQRFINPFGRFPRSEWAACFPDGCMGKEMEDVYKNVIKDITGLGVETVDIEFDDKMCQTSKQAHPKLTFGAITTIIILSTIVFVMLLSTVYNFYCHHTKQAPIHPIVLAFSVSTNAQKLFRINSNDPYQIPCLNGIRVLSMLWVILGHHYGNLRTVAVTNSLDIEKWLSSFHSMILLGATVSVDTFFLLGGILVVYGFLKAVDETLTFNVPKFWLQRYLRLTPALVALMLVTANLMKYFANGPKTPHEDNSSCITHWWSTLLYIQNYVNIKDMCIGHSWYLNADMQLYFLSPMVLIPLRKWQRCGLALLLFSTIISMVIPFTIAWVTDMSISLLDGENHNYNDNYYFVTHTRTTPWFVGILLGYYIYSVKTSRVQPKWNLFFVITAWVTSLMVLFACVFGGHKMVVPEGYQKLTQVLYITFVRPAWAIALGWVVIACTVGYGGPINWIISLPVYQIFGRFTFSWYLLHPIVLELKFANRRVPMHFSHFEMIYSYCGTLLFTTLLSLFWILAFESPVIAMNKILFHRRSKQNENTDIVLSNNNNHNNQSV